MESAIELAPHMRAVAQLWRWPEGEIDGPARDHAHVVAYKAAGHTIRLARPA
ncbi:MAG: hypothetical protein IV086_02445 [Hyphomonadaceae bacterium]|nr:hypothetical protein [Hyphomonadaceae bacterium]